MNSINKKRLQILEETVEYYSQDPKERRCLDSRGLCWYSGKGAGKNSNGCAIGRLIPEQLRLEFDNERKEYEKIDKYYNVSVGGSPIFNRLPDDIRQLGVTFLGMLQESHDNNDFWDESGLTSEGKEWYESIKNQINNNEYV